MQIIIAHVEESLYTFSVIWAFISHARCRPNRRTEKGWDLERNKGRKGAFTLQSPCWPMIADAGSWKVVKIPSGICPFQLQLTISWWFRWQDDCLRLCSIAHECRQPIRLRTGRPASIAAESLWLMKITKWTRLVLTVYECRQFPGKLLEIYLD